MVGNSPDVWAGDGGTGPGVHSTLHRKVCQLSAVSTSEYTVLYSNCTTLYYWELLLVTFRASWPVSASPREQTVTHWPLHLSQTSTRLPYNLCQTSSQLYKTPRASAKPLQTSTRSLGESPPPLSDLRPNLIIPGNIVRFLS